MTKAELDLAQLLIDTLNIEDKKAASVDPLAPLFGAHDVGWGLDSIDALEIALAVKQRYGVEMRADDDASRSAFTCLHSLSEFVIANAVIHS